MARVRYIPQLEVAECGAACLAMVLDRYGAAVPLVEVRQACGVSRDGVSAFGILEAAGDYGLEVEAYKGDLDVLEGAHFPVIAHWEGRHFVVIERIATRGCVVVDPALGRRFLSRDELSASCSGIYLDFCPTSDLVRVPRRRWAHLRYMGALRACWPGVAMVVVAASVLQVLAVIFPAMTQVFIDHVLRPARDQWLWPLVIALGLAAVARTVIGYLRDRATHALQVSLDLELMARFMTHLVRLPITFFDQRTPGDLMERVRVNQTLRDAFSQAVAALFDGVLVVGYCAVMLAYHFRLGVIVIAFSLVRILLVTLLRSRARRGYSTELAQRSRERSAALEGFVSPEAIRAFGMQETLISRYGARMSRRVNAARWVRRLTETVDESTALVNGLSRALVVVVGGSAVLASEMTPGIFVGFLTLQSLMKAPLESVVVFINRWILSASILERIEDVLQTSTGSTGGRTRLPAMRGEIRLHDVSYAYGPRSEPVCSGIDLTIRPGETVAIVGAPGSGKTTLARLIAGLLVPTEGTVSIDGSDLVDVDVSNLHRRIGVVLQEPYLFADTVRANISLGAADIGLEQIQEAARVACIDDVVDALPLGYETRLHEAGARLSGGQRQRLALARAVARDPKILILDEATSSLDLETERRVHSHLRHLKMTQVVIAHRMATVVDADRIVVLEEGKIVQQGTFAELSETAAPFRGLVLATEVP